MVPVAARNSEGYKLKMLAEEKIRNEIKIPRVETTCFMPLRFSVLSWFVPASRK